MISLQKCIKQNDKSHIIFLSKHIWCSFYISLKAHPIKILQKNNQLNWSTEEMKDFVNKSLDENNKNLIMLFVNKYIFKIIIKYYTI